MNDSEPCSCRHKERNFTAKDWVQIVGLIAALVAQYVAISNRLSVVETKVVILYDGMQSRINK